MKKYLLVPFLFFAALNTTFSQNNNGTDQTGSSSFVTFSPFSLLDIYAPRMRVGYIQHLADHWKIGLDLGLGAGTGLLSKRESEEDILWEVRPEIYYILKPTSRTLKYLAIEFFYIDQSSILLNNEYRDSNGLNIGYDSAEYERQKYGAHLKFGLFLNLSKHWGFDFYGGVGFRFKTTVFSNVANAQEVTNTEHRHGFDTIYNAEGSDFRPNPALGAKLYYRF